MRDRRPDWREESARKLADSRLSAAEREEIARELAGYLDDLCSDAPARGLDDSAATQSAAAELHEEKHLGAKLYHARREGIMNDRTKQLWLPGIVMLFAAAATLAASQVAGSSVYDAYAPTPQATHNLLELLAYLRRYRAAALLIYFGWLGMVPLLGAIGAYWSRHAGSARATQIAAGLSPLVLFLAIFIGQRSVAQKGTSLPFLAMDALPPAHLFFPVLSTSSSLLLSWVVIPGAALLLGILPFLRGNVSRENAQQIAERASHHA